MKKLIIVLLLCFIYGCQKDGHSHDFAPANYQTPSTCRVCGETRGEKLTADFERYEIKPDLETLNKQADFVTSTHDEEKNLLKVEGTVSVLKDEITAESPFTSVATDGSYEVREIEMKLVVGDENSNQYGFDYNYVITDYYDIEGFTASFHYDEASKANVFTVNYNGQNYDNCQLMVNVNSGEWEEKEPFWTKTVSLKWYLAVPKGYDGIVIGLRNSAVDPGETAYFNQYYSAEDFVLYRTGGKA